MGAWTRGVAHVWHSGGGGVGDHEVKEALGDLDEGLGLVGVEAVADGVGDLLPGGVSAHDAGAAEVVDEERAGLVDDAMRCGVHGGRSTKAANAPVGLALRRRQPGALSRGVSTNAPGRVVVGRRGGRRR